jgi:hypothetical protein
MAMLSVLQHLSLTPTMHHELKRKMKKEGKTEKKLDKDKKKMGRKINLMFRRFLHILIKRK